MIRLEIDRFGVGLLGESSSSCPGPNEDLELLFLIIGDDGLRLEEAELDGRAPGAFDRRGEGGFENAADCETRRVAGLDMLGVGGLEDLPNGASLVFATGNGFEICDRLELSREVSSGGGLGGTMGAPKG